MTSLPVDVTIVTESWLHDKIDDDLLVISSCTMFRCDRPSRRGGGVCVWIKSSLEPLSLLPKAPLPSTIELIIVRLSCGAFHVVCYCIYVPPGLNKANHDVISDFIISEFDHILSVFPNDKLIIAGDLNDFDCSFLCENFRLVNRVTEATRGNAILDHIWIDESLCEFYPTSACIGPPLKNSDHNCVFLRSLCQPSPTTDRRATLVWDLRDSFVREFVHRLSTTVFDVNGLTESESRPSGNSVDFKLTKFYESLYSCLSVIPREVVFLSSSDKPWMTPILKLLIEKRWRAFRDKNWPLYRHYKEKVSAEIKKAKRIWSSNQSKSPRGLWNIVKVERGSGSKEPWSRLLKENGGLPALLSNLTTEFCSNFSTDSDVNLVPLRDETWDFSVSSASVFRLLSRVKSRKASGPDLIPSLLLRVGAEFLCGPLAAIFNISIATKTFPTQLKHAHVCPVPKTSSPRMCDFRPISLLSPIAKIFEKLVLSHLRVKLFSCFGPEQHAYRPLSSTCTALVVLCEHVSRALDCQQTSSVNVFCLDLSRAFDKLQHHRLVNHLSECGFNHGFLCWLLSYLSDRIMNVKVMNNLGPPVSIPSGVPQGSVLGPFLFAAFMGSISFSFSNVRCIKYADDVSLIEPLSCQQSSSVSLDACVSVFNNKGLSVNRSKCKQIVFCRTLTPSVTSVSGFVMEHSLKILGVVFSDNFKWDSHVSVMIRAASRRLYIIRRLKEFVNKHELIRIYHAIITSLFLYASPVYGRLPLKLLSKLERFQRRVHRIICGPDCSCDLFPVLSSKLDNAAVKLLLLSEGIRDHPLHDFVPPRLPASNRLRVPMCDTNRRQNTFFPWATVLYNSLF